MGKATVGRAKKPAAGVAAPGHSRVVTMVFDEILAAVHTGTLLPGERISDAELAERLGVSRTPVREALLRLREIGIVEASASRFTRIADVTPLQTTQAFTVWLVLYGALLDEVIRTAPPSVVESLEADHAEFTANAAEPAPSAQRLATANFWFYQRLVDISANPALQRAITSVVHVVRLGGVHLPAYVDVPQLATAQKLLIGAVRDRDVTAAKHAMAVLSTIDIPLT